MIISIVKVKFLNLLILMRFFFLLDCEKNVKLDPIVNKKNGNIRRFLLLKKSH